MTEVQNMTQPFSVCMSVYKNDKPADVVVALDSIILREWRSSTFARK